MSALPFRTSLGALALTLLLIAACAAPALPSLEDRLSDPRLSRAPLPQGSLALREALDIESRFFETRAGLRLAYALMEPGQYGFETEVAREGDTHFRFRAQQATARRAPVGSALLLHGWGMDRSSLYPWALQLAEAGYRVLLVDLRSHGESGDAAPGYGRREAEDLVELIRALDADAQLPGALHLFGVSYGGATAAHLSARLPERIASVVLLEPFANAADAIREMVPTLLASSDPRLWQRISRSLLRFRFSPERVEQAIAESSERLGLDLESVDLAPLLAASPACKLLLHGARDRHVGVQHGRRLAAGDASIEYRELPDEDHITLPLRLDWLGEPVAEWLAATAAPTEGGCPRLRLGMDPLPAGTPPSPGRLDLIDFALVDATRPHG
jgi:pimeloyl-ACP methyl ester carboxylesterase